MTDPLRQLWQEHQRSPFPESVRGEDIGGVDLVLIDADIAGCVASCVDAPRNLDQMRRDILAGCRKELDLVLPHLARGDEDAYVTRLAAMADLALAAR